MNDDDNEAAGRQAEDPPRPDTEAPRTSPSSRLAGGGEQPLDEWEPFALARDEVMRNRRASKAGAAEWLRQAAVNGEVRVRFAERYYALEQSKGARYLALRRTGPRTDEEAEFLAGYTPSDPLDVLRDRPDSMKKHEIKNFTEWHVGDLRPPLARNRAAGGEAPEPAGEPAALADRKGVGG